jgi:acetate CoA/acetoacetate CoA-transferase alpha subunit
MPKIISAKQAAELVKDGMTIMIGGFLGCGNPHKIIDALVEKGVKNLTLIANDTSLPNYGISKLIANHQVKRLLASHIGTNPETGAQMTAGELEVNLIPQGTLAERIRCGGNGIGGFLTPTGVGTVVAIGKQQMELNGKEYILETPLRADVAIINGYRVDKSGNIWYIGSTRNFNNIMATAADVVIVEADTLVEIGEIEPENVVTPGIFIDYIVEGSVL